MKKAAVICLGPMLSAALVQAQDRQSALLAYEPAAARWIYSETVSPLDYAPVVIASAWSNERSDGPAMQLSIQCRRGRTSLVIVSPALAGPSGAQRIGWTVNDGPATELRTDVAPTGTGIVVKDDVLRLLDALPAEGEVAVQVTMPQGTPLHGRYAIAPLKTMLGRMAAPCKWQTQ
jgi:hypothetical protein